MEKRIFYFNITYSCNSNCIFCYSHNTYHNGIIHNEIDLNDFEDYIDRYDVSVSDRVIINGGEPLLHTDFMGILKILEKRKCETLVYTNGRLLNEFSFNEICLPIRFIVPIHGNEDIHDKITGVKGSYHETISALKSFENNKKDLVDIKIIINNEMIKSGNNFNDILYSFNEVYFNNAVHLTRMADTIISLRNKCQNIDNDIASAYLKKLYLYFRNRAKIIRIFDTCIKSLDELKKYTCNPYPYELKVFFRDYNQERNIILKKPDMPCRADCDFCELCKSAVDEYKVLEISQCKISENLE